MCVVINIYKAYEISTQFMEDVAGNAAIRLTDSSECSSKQSACSVVNKVA
jgi:hypothetical protein